MHLPCPPEKSGCIQTGTFYRTSLKSECTLCLQTPALFSQTKRTLRHHSSLSLYLKKGSSTLKPFMYIKYSFKKPNNEDFIAQQTASSTVFGTLIMEILSFCLTFISFAVMRMSSLSWGFYWNLCLPGDADMASGTKLTIVSFMTCKTKKQLHFLRDRKAARCKAMSFHFFPFG